MSEIAGLEAEAKAKAAKHVANMLKAPDKLEKPVPIELELPNLTAVSSLSPGATTEITTITMDASSGEVLSFIGSSPSPGGGHFQPSRQTHSINFSDMNVSDFNVPHIKEEVVFGSDLLMEDVKAKIKAEKERATFWPERPTKSDPSLTSAGVKANTVLTNLQRGNIPTMQTFVVEPVVQTLHQRAGQGELRARELSPSMIDDQDLRKRTPLMWSAYYGQTPTVNLLLRHGANVHCRADEDETALHLAASAGHQDIVRILLNHGAEVDALDENSHTPIMFATMKNHPHCVNELLNQGSDVTLKNINDESVLSLAIQANAFQAQAVLEEHIVNAIEDLMQANNKSSS